MSIIKRFKTKGQDEKMSLAQGYIPEKLHKAVSKQMMRDREKGIRVNWKILIEQACRAYLEERR